MVQYLSGPDAGKFGRTYSWPVKRASDSATDARRRAMATLAPGMRLASSRSRNGLVEFTCMGWSSSSDSSQNRGPPDLVAFGRAARVGDRLVAGYLLVRVEGPDIALEKTAREIVSRLVFRSGRDRDVITGYGSVWRPPTPKVGRSQRGRVTTWGS